MKPKILITGPPRCGKSTMITKLIEFYSKKNYKIYGFLTPEVKHINKRVGFDVQDIFTKIKFPLARIGNFNSEFKLGKYSVFIKEFEKYLDSALNMNENEIDLLIIDEIGKMELFSKKFQDFIKKFFQSEIPIIATIGEKINHPVKDFILEIQNTTLILLNRENKNDVFLKIRNLLEY